MTGNSSNNGLLITRQQSVPFDIHQSRLLIEDITVRGNVGDVLSLKVEVCITHPLTAFDPLPSPPFSTLSSTPLV